MGIQFLNLIQSDLCPHHHSPDDALVLGPGPALHCRVCQTAVIPDVYAHINRPSADYFLASQLGQAYAQWTGDLNVPISFPLSHIDGIRDTVVVGQSLERVEKSIRWLRALNAPFTTDPVAGGGGAAAAGHEMDTFLRDFLSIIYQHPPAETSDERTALNALMKSMHGILSARDAVNPFETYFQVLVPYVQRCFSSWQPFPAEPVHSNLARELHTQLIRSFRIRQLFGRYAIPLDVMHVMVACYACSCSMDVVGNFAIDFLVRICRGQFFWAQFPHCVFVQAMQQLVRARIHPRKNSHWYQCVVRPFKEGQAIHMYSQMWTTLHDVQRALKGHFRVPDTTPDMLDMAFAHTFPAVLFQDCSDQLGYTMGYNHLIMALNRHNGQLPKGAFKKARRIHDVVQRFVNQILAFDEGKDTAIWDLDMVKLFFARDENFHQEIMEVVHMVVTEDDDNGNN